MLETQYFNGVVKLQGFDNLFWELRGKNEEQEIEGKNI